MQDSNKKDTVHKMDLEMNINILRRLGLWSKSLNFFKLLVLFMLASQICTQVGAVIQFWGDVHNVSMNACLMFTFMSGLFKVSTFLLSRNRILNLIDDMEDNLVRYGSMVEAQQAGVLNVAAKRAKEVSLTFLIVGAFALTLFILSPAINNILDNSSTIDEAISNISNVHMAARNLPTPAWFPYDPTISPYYEISYIYQSLSIFTVYISTSTLDNLYVSLIIFLAAQLQILNSSLVNIRRNVLLKLGMQNSSRQLENTLIRLWDTRSDYESEIKTGILEPNVKAFRTPILRGLNMMKPLKIIDGGYDQKLIDAAIDDHLIQCVHYHQSIIRSVKELESIISPAVMAQFMTSVAVICLTAFVVSVTTASDLGPLATYGSYLATMMYELFMYCWYGNDIIVESERFQLAAYSCEWPEGSIRFRNSMKILMMRAGRPLRITVGKFYSISRETFLKLLNGSYSYFALLRQVNDRE